MKSVKSLLWIGLAVFALMPGVAYMADTTLLACGATECSYGTGCYSQGACRGGQQCTMNGSTVEWVSGCQY